MFCRITSLLTLHVNLLNASHTRTLVTCVVHRWMDHNCVSIVEQGAFDRLSSLRELYALT